MNHIWSPWRMTYIQQQKPSEGCIFCKAVNAEDTPENLIVRRGQYAFVILNLFPYTTGHVMVVPFQHSPLLKQLSAEIRAEMMELMAQSIQVIQLVYQPQGYNLGMNIGQAAGAGIVDHIHMHIVPRWTGDTNFMSTLSMVRVLPETLDQTYSRLKAGWEVVQTTLQGNNP